MVRSRCVGWALGVLVVTACSAPATDESPPDELMTLGEALQDTSPPVSATTPPPGSVNPCSGLVAYVPFKVNSSNTSVSYTRPSGCPGWSGLEAEFTTTTDFNRRKLYATIGFDYSSASNPQAKCLASKIEYETYRRVTFNGNHIWLPTAIESITPHWTGSICYWHNFNGSTPSDPGVYNERIRARGVRFDGQVVNAVVGARVQSQSIP